jgi:SAM-dependent methyltransferase
MPANDEQIEYWNGQAGATWVESQAQIDVMLAPFTALAIDRADPRSGERAVDVGCGCGDSTLALAARGASVWGIDISEPMLARAKERAARLPNVAFARTDAATQAFTPDHELVFSRFGVMFFDDPVAAFSNLRTGLVAGGRLVFVCWQAPRDNPWMALAGRAVQPYLPQPAVPPDPRAPGPFAFADRDYLHGILAGAGYTAITIEDERPTLAIADTLDEAVAFQSRVGPLSRALAELEGKTRERALEAARAALEGEMTEAGLRLGAACWLVEARNP